MKHLFFTAFVFAFSGVYGQKIITENGAITVIAKSISVKQAFQLTDKLLSTKTKIYDRYVLKDGVTYYRAGVGVFRKPPVYKIVDGKFIKVRIV
jgi:hypothetical protein